jgi:hypothetical protein
VRALAAEHRGLSNGASIFARDFAPPP